MTGRRVSCGVGTERRNFSLVQHAVVRGAAKALCGETIQLVVIGDWQVPFMPSVASACEECVRLLAGRFES